MKVILLDYVYKHGVAGEVIDVADGFARNYLLPKGLAVQATPGEMKRAARLREQAAVRRAALENRMNELAQIIDGVELIFGRRAAPTGKLFGSVTTQEIADELMEKTGVDINRRRISQQGLRELGTHDVSIRLGNEIMPSIKVTVVRDDELADFLAAREAAAQAGESEDTEDTGDETPVDTEQAPTGDDMQTEVLPASAVREAMAAYQQETAEADGESDADDAPPAQDSDDEENA